MLQHSHISFGNKAETDINVLVQEYVRLAKNGFKAKDSFFNAHIETNFDQSHKKISIIPQDIGRVILNVINNAYYAVNERQKTGEEGYVPKVTISTQNNYSQPDNQKNTITITISDNGFGIPDSIV